MKRGMGRRSFLQGALAVAAVTAFDPVNQSWATEPGPATLALPEFNGELLLDLATRTAAEDDFGHIVHRLPLAVLVPRSVEDIVKMVRFARAHGLKVAAERGLGESHSTQGQSQVEAGVAIAMSGLSTIHEINAADAWVDAGVRWIQLLEATVPLGKSPPTLTDLIELSIGGTLSVGGIGGQAHRAGLQVDNVLELEVVTGTGERVRCSPSENRVLFDAVRAGLGQFGIIVRARVRLVDMPSRVRTYTALYSDLGTFLRDQTALIDEGRFEYVEGNAQPANGGWVYQLEVAKYFEPGAEPDDARLLAGLSFTPGTAQSHDSTYFDFANRLAPLVEFLKQLGAWGLPHPWLNLFIPEREAESFVARTLAGTTDADMGQGPILLYPFHRNRLTAPFTRVPESRHVFLLALLRTAVPPTPEVVAGLLVKNRAIYEQLTALGGKRYPIDSVPMSAADWRAHFFPFWERFEHAKRRFDPDGVLTPGQGIF